MPDPRRRLAELEEFEMRVQTGCILCGRRRNHQRVGYSGVKLCVGCFEAIVGEARLEMLAQIQVRDDRRDRLARTPKREQSVYFAHLGHAVKIGIAIRPRQRVKVFGGARLVATEPGGQHRESYLHYLFADKRLHGEWFHLDRELQLYVEGLPTFTNWGSFFGADGRGPDVGSEAAVA